MLPIHPPTRIRLEAIKQAIRKRSRPRLTS
jgi:hypothetical protein